jgi:hypothetical protein
MINNNTNIFLSKEPIGFNKSTNKKNHNNTQSKSIDLEPDNYDSYKMLNSNGKYVNKDKTDLIGPSNNVKPFTLDNNAIITEDVYKVATLSSIISLNDINTSNQVSIITMEDLNETWENLVATDELIKLKMKASYNNNIRNKNHYWDDESDTEDELNKLSLSSTIVDKLNENWENYNVVNELIKMKFDAICKNSETTQIWDQKLDENHDPSKSKED